MKSTRSFLKIAPLILLLSFAACGATVPVFVVRPISWEGALYDEDGKKAHDFRICKPTSAKEPCVVLFWEDAEKLEAENAALKKRVAELEKKCGHE